AGAQGLGGEAAHIRFQDATLSTWPRFSFVSQQVLIGTWIGLIAGFGDVGILVLNRRLIFRDFYHLRADFPWIVPSGVMVMVLVPALLIALFARIRGSVRLSVPVLLFSFVGFLDLSSRLRLELWASLIIS